MTHPKIGRVGELTEYVNQAIYGPSGAGKTTYAGSAKKLLLVDIEQGTTALAAQGTMVDVWKITEFDEIWEVYDYLKKNPGEYESVALDSYSDLCSKCLETVVDEAEARDTRRMTDAAELRDHGRVTLKMAKVLRRFRDLPINLILICTERGPTEHNKFRTGPNLPESLTLQLIAYMDMIGFLDIVEKVDESGDVTVSRKLLFYSPSGAIRVKDRFGVFTPETGERGLTNPTHPSTLAYVRGKVRERLAIQSHQNGETPPSEGTDGTKRQPRKLAAKRKV